MNARYRIVLADDHPIVLDGLRGLIEAQPDLDLVGEATSGLAALRIDQGAESGSRGDRYIDAGIERDFSGPPFGSRTAVGEASRPHLA